VNVGLRSARFRDWTKAMLSNRRSRARSGKRRWNARRLVLAVVCSIVTLSVAPASASIVYIWGAPYADNSVHTHTSTESDPGDRQFWASYMNPSFANDYDPTDLVTVDYGTTYDHTIDVYWFATPSLPNPAAAAQTDCREWVTSTKCERFRVQIKEDAANLSVTLRHNLACHEIGHTVGFRDGADAGTSCMNGGDNGILTQAERNVINARY